MVPRSRAGRRSDRESARPQDPSNRRGLYWASIRAATPGAATTLGVREAFEYRGSAEEVISVREVVTKMAVTFSAAATTQSARAPRLVFRHERIHQDRVPLTVNER